MDNQPKEQVSFDGQLSSNASVCVDGRISPEEKLSYDEKLRLTDRDALRAVAALGAVVAVWLVCGFGLSGFDAQIFHVPLWVVGGLLGTWAAAIVAAIVLARSFRDFDLNDDAERDVRAGGEGGASDG